MSKYDKETKFYWLMLNENFFEDDAISWLEEQQPNGRDYAYFYLKICLLALKTNGILIRKVGKMLLPYDAKKLSEITKIEFDTVVVAIDFNIYCSAIGFLNFQIFPGKANIQIFYC